MNSPIKDDSLEELARVLKETDHILEQLFSLQDDYPDIREELEEAQECVEEALDMRTEDAEELQAELLGEAHRVEELGFYVRVLQDFCRNSHVELPAFIISGFQRLCQKTYLPPERITAPTAISEEEELPF